ncbi:MAG: SOS response-associated peptidase family protein [Acinetobacter sp.]
MGYAPGWWDKPPLINARSETAATSRMFKPLWQLGRAICFADGWFEWKKEGDKKQPYFIYQADGQPIFMAANVTTPKISSVSSLFIIMAAYALFSGTSMTLGCNCRRLTVNSPSTVAM